MAYEVGKKYCGLCRRRPLETGGNNSCPIKVLGKAWRESPHLPNDCNYFKPGDLMRKHERRNRRNAPTPMDPQLFDDLGLSPEDALKLQMELLG